MTENRKMFVLNLLGHFVLDDCELAAIVAASGANRVVDVESTAVGALGERGSYGLVMGATLEGTSLRLSSFRMCHCCIVFCIIILGVLRIIYNDDCSRIYGYRKVRNQENDATLQSQKRRGCQLLRIRLRSLPSLSYAMISK